jgi:hypothetical protein
MEPSKALQDIIAERGRQIHKKMHTFEWDQVNNPNGELLDQALQRIDLVRDSIKPPSVSIKDLDRKLLVEAAALLLAEIERQDLAEIRSRGRKS